MSELLPTLEQAWMQEVSTVLDALGTRRDSGLEPSEVALRFAQDGRNELEERGGKTPLRIF